MLRISELVKAIELALSVGERPYGHFDHDAKCFTGSFVKNYRSQSNYLFKQEDLTSKIQTIVPKNRYEAFEDSETGEILYRPVIEKK